MKYLGNRKEFEGLDAFEGPAVELVRFTSHEVTALCPVTEGPDLYTVVIEYVPNLLYVESKSLKMYLNSFRNDGIFGESLAEKIKNDLIDVIKPTKLSVKIKQQTRGGLILEAEARYVVGDKPLWPKKF